MSNDIKKALMQTSSNLAASSEVLSAAIRNYAQDVLKRVEAAEERVDPAELQMAGHMLEQQTHSLELLTRVRLQIGDFDTQELVGTSGAPLRIDADLTPLPREVPRDPNLQTSDASLPDGT